MDNLKIFTNHLPGGWSPFDIDQYLGGSEEVVVLLANELKKHFNVIVYHTQKNKSLIKYKDVTYLDRSEACTEKDDIFITFKDYNPWKSGADCKLKIHWSSEVENPWNVDKIDYFVNLTNYHKSRHIWVDYKKSKVIPHGIDKDSLEKNKSIKKSNLMIYSSSPDRGLESLLKDWNSIKYYFPKLKLKISYGFNYFDRFTTHKFNGEKYKAILFKMMAQKDIEYVGELSKDDIEKLYWQADYWVMPLIKPDSELFCLNAIKTKYTNCKPVVNKIGALQNTVSNYIPYTNLIKGDGFLLKPEGNFVNALCWEEIVNKYWLPILKK